MLLYALLAVLILFCLFVLFRWFIDAEPKAVLRVLKWLGFGFVLAFILWLVFSGKLGLAFAALPALFVWFQRFRMIFGIGKMLRGLFGASQTQGQGAPSRATGGMSREEAFEVLGLEEDASPEEIKAAYHRLIAQAHPDKGGSDYLAARINEARDVLLDD